MSDNKKKWKSSRLEDKRRELGLDKKKSSDDKKFSSKKPFDKNNRNKDNRSNKNDVKRKKFNDNKEKFVVRISNLPDDITVNEILNEVSKWGDVGNVNVKKYYDSTSCYIDFYNLDEVKYFIGAFDNTLFDHMVINVELMNFNK